MQRMTGFEVTRKRDNRLEKDVLPAIVLFNEKKNFFSQVIQSLHTYICI